MRLGGLGILAGYTADLAFGDPQRLHPVAGFGRLAGAVERVLYGPTRLRGFLYAVVLVGLSSLAAHLVARRGRPSVALAVFIWTALGGRSLTREARAIAGLIGRSDLSSARLESPKLAGRDPSGLNEVDLCRALIESVAENTSDAVVGPLLWGAVAGPAGVVAFRAANTLDAMVGHRNARFEQFGWAAARLDDAMCWPAARLASLLAVVCTPIVHGSPRLAWRTLWRDGGSHPSPNAGLLEAVFAGALDIQLGGTLSYDGRVEHRPLLGEGRQSSLVDVDRAARLSSMVGVAAALVCAALRCVLERRTSR